MDFLIAWGRVITLGIIITITITLSVILYRLWGKKKGKHPIGWALLTFGVVFAAIFLYVAISSVVANNWRYPSVIDVSPLAQINAKQMERVEEAVLLLVEDSTIRLLDTGTSNVDNRHAAKTYRMSWTEETSNNFRTNSLINVTVYPNEELAARGVQYGRSSFINFNHVYTTIANANNTEAILGHPRTDVCSGGWYIPGNDRIIISYIRLDNVVIRFSESRLWNDLDYGENITSRYIALLAQALHE